VASAAAYRPSNTKGELLQAVYEHAVPGPEAITRFVAGTLQLLARAAPLVWSVLGDEGAREGYEHNEQLRRFGYAELVTVLAEKHPLRPGLTPLGARDILLVLTGPQLFVRYTRDLGWKVEELAA
jgi:hypothetical protein